MLSLHRLLFAVVAAGGVLSGQSALGTAAIGQPPLNWLDIGIIASGTVAALSLVLGVQALRADFRALHRGIHLFSYVAVYVAFAGLAALVESNYGSGVTPRALLFLVIGVAMILGLGVLKIVFRRKMSTFQALAASRLER